jgi:DNA helicase-2/ATP-dependent DNA helicase PcrA
MIQPPHTDDKIKQILGSQFTPSSYQLAIYRHLLEGKGDLLVEAAAGSGKTTTILQAAKIIQMMNKTWQFVAFGHDISAEINLKLEKMGMKNASRTAHQLGKIALLKKLKKNLKEPDERKYPRLARNLVNGLIRPTTKLDEQHALSTLVEVAKLARLTLTPPDDHEALLLMAQHYNIDLVLSTEFSEDADSKTIEKRKKEEQRLETLTLQAIKPLIEEGIEVAENGGIIEFTDMLYLPYAWNLTPYQSDIILCDECQDLSASQLDLVLKLRKRNGMIIFVGDPHQAIFGFAGADNYSFYRIQERTNAKILPLSISYRCPLSHITLAQKIVPSIEPKPDAPEGIIETIPSNKLASTLRQQIGECLILCRTTAPIVELCLKLIGQRINARVRGREIGSQLLSIIDDVCQLTNFTWEKFGAWLEVYQDAQTRRLLRTEGNEAKIQALQDRVEAIKTCYTHFTNAEIATAAIFKNHVQALFSDKNPGIWLSTVHRAKGLEQKYIYILKKEKLPLAWQGQQAWEYEQEMNLKYVALTRSTHGLYFISDEQEDDN